MPFVFVRGLGPVADGGAGVGRGLEAWDGTPDGGAGGANVTAFGRGEVEDAGAVVAAAACSRPLSFWFEYW